MAGTDAKAADALIAAAFATLGGVARWADSRRLLESAAGRALLDLPDVARGVVLLQLVRQLSGSIRRDAAYQRAHRDGPIGLRPFYRERAFVKQALVTALVKRRVVLSPGAFAEIVALIGSLPQLSGRARLCGAVATLLGRRQRAGTISPRTRRSLLSIARAMESAGRAAEYRIAARIRRALAGDAGIGRNPGMSARRSIRDPRA